LFEAINFSAFAFAGGLVAMGARFYKVDRRAARRAAARRHGQLPVPMPPAAAPQAGEKNPGSTAVVKVVAAKK